MRLTDLKASTQTQNEKLCCGYSFEAPDQGASNEYPQLMFSWRNKKNIIWISPHIWRYEMLIHYIFVSIIVIVHKEGKDHGRHITYILWFRGFLNT